MKYFALKISDPNAIELVEMIKSGSKSIQIQQLNQLENELLPGNLVFLQLGGDKVSWQKGLIGLAEIEKRPYDKGYDCANKRNFKIGLSMLVVLPEAIRREEFKFYVDAYDAAGIGPNTRGEQSQAIKSLSQKQAAAIMRAMADKYDWIADQLKENLSKEIVDAVFGEMPYLVEYNMSFEEARAFNRDRKENQKVSGKQDKLKAKGGFNKIYYGAPGCGKSHYISEMLEKAKVKEENIFRVTFHPEYMNCDFVGQILPTIEETIDSNTSGNREVVRYAFNPGPFTLALKRAYQISDMVYLIIEEINRGNAPAIFGDLFQLLDRVKGVDDSRFSSSEYPVRNPGVQDYLSHEKDIDFIVETVKKKGIFIPGNLTILATMNSSDQNVFTLDTAFKRRWLFEQISNDILSDDEHEYKNWYVPGTDVCWGTFLSKLNDEILNYKIQNQTNEDKRLGKYFVTQDCLTESANTINRQAAGNFGYKVLEYVWNDICKIGRDDWFDLGKYRTLEDLIEAFVNPVDGEKPLDIFRNIKFGD